MSQSKSTINNKLGKTLIPLVILTSLFFILGFATWLNGPLIPFFELALELSPSQAYFMAFAFYIAYFVMALPSTWVIEKVGYKNSVSVGLVVIALGAFMFYPAAEARTFLLFLVALLVMGTGLAILQTAASPYIVVIGLRESTAARISVLGIANKLAGFIAPLVLTALVLSNMQQYTADKIAVLDLATKSAVLDYLALQLQRPYLYMGAIILALAALVKLSPLPEIDLDKDGKVLNQSVFIQKVNTFKYPQLVLGVITLMVYLAAEVLAGDSIGGFRKQLSVYGENGDFYLKLASFTMIAMVIGYILGVTLIHKYVSQMTALKTSGILGLISALLITMISATILIQLPDLPTLPLVIILI
ncbi:glucose/galactose MFS transporter [Flavobacterium sp. SOK18b]|uniref:MFS transporter n=1 Tax=Flavobacterium sp. SOK18b TaxID=797900 RepID=UPI0015F80B6C|nr:MFS transporter [Flavobacterium sp. SOK18b]MBB1194914.1 glucose/galactose MFS transporter [Flavobacterium sp. SOK18b]